MKVANKKVTAERLVRDALKKAKHFEDYHIFTFLDEEGAIERAREIDAKLRRGEKVGRLAGVPYALKDNFLSPRGETTASALILEGLNSPITATSVKRLEDEGAIMIGRTNMDAFAHGSSTENSYYGPTLNSHDTERVAGGSSGGSAVAVALDIVEFATGTDTGGSIRQPASFNGIYGLKPTYGTISRYGVVAMASSTDCIGFFTKTPEDMDLLMSVASGQDPKDMTTLPDYYNNANGRGLSEPIFSDAGLEFSSTSYAGTPAEPSLRDEPVGSVRNIRVENSNQTFMRPKKQVSATRALKIALIGRPNVGKSSLFNALGKKQQAIVSSRQGTTRDVNRVSVKYKGRELEILDTAGLRKPGKREVGIEKFSAIRTLAAIEEADICCLLVDATEPHAKLDQTLAGQIVEAGKGIIMVVTKVDLLKSSAEDLNTLLDDLERDFDFLPFAPVVLTSSETGENVTRLFELALQIDESRHQEIKTSELNKILSDAMISHPPAGLKNTRPKPKYIVQTDTCPPWFVVHGHDLGLLHWSWKRFLERKIREKYPFIGTPIMFSFRNDQK